MSVHQTHFCLGDIAIAAAAGAAPADVAAIAAAVSTAVPERMVSSVFSRGRMLTMFSQEHRSEI